MELESSYIERVTPTETPFPMTQSQRILAALAALNDLTQQALSADSPEALAALERQAQWVEADLAPTALPTSVWFDLPPNEWWEAN